MGDSLTKRLQLIVGMDTSKVKTGMDSIKSKLSGLSGALRTGAIAYFTRDFVKAFSQQEMAVAELSEALKRQGQYSAAAAKQLNKYSEELQKQTVYADDAIASGMALIENISGLSRDQLPAAAKAAIGFADALKIDLQSAFMLLGRSAAGQNQLWTRYGVVLDMTKSKEEIFQDVLAMGNKHFATSTALAETATGKVKQFGNAIGDLKETLGAVIMEGMTPIISALKAITAGFNAMPEAIRMPIATIGLLIAVLKVLGISFASMWTAALGPIGLVVAGITLVYTAIKTNLFGIVKATGEEFAALDTKVQNAATAMDTQNREIGYLVATYKELSPLVNLTAEQKERLRIATEGIAKVMPSVVSAYDSEGKATAINISLYEQLIELQREEYEMLVQKRRIALEKDIATMQKRADAIRYDISIVQDYLKRWEGVDTALSRQTIEQGNASIRARGEALGKVNAELSTMLACYAKLSGENLPLPLVFEPQINVMTEDLEKQYSQMLSGLSDDYKKATLSNYEYEAAKVNDLYKQRVDLLNEVAKTGQDVSEQMHQADIARAKALADLRKEYIQATIPIWQQVIDKVKAMEEAAMDDFTSRVATRMYEGFDYAKTHGMGYPEPAGATYEGTGGLDWNNILANQEGMDTWAGNYLEQLDQMLAGNEDLASQADRTATAHLAMYASMQSAGTAAYNAMERISFAYFNNENRRMKTLKVLGEQMYLGIAAAGIQAVADVLQALSKELAIRAGLALILGQYGRAAKLTALVAATGAAAGIVSGMAHAATEKAERALASQVGGTRLDTTGTVETDITGRPTGSSRYGATTVTTQPQAITIAPTLTISGQTILIGDLGVDELEATLGRVIVDTVKSAIELGEIEVN